MVERDCNAMVPATAQAGDAGFSALFPVFKGLSGDTMTPVVAVADNSRGDKVRPKQQKYNLQLAFK